MSGVCTSATIQKLTEVFSCFEPTHTIISDYGTQFSSSQFDKFYRGNRVNRFIYPLYHPQSNGQAERFVDSLKRTIQEVKEKRMVEEIIQLFFPLVPSKPDKKQDHVLIHLFYF